MNAIYLFIMNQEHIFSFIIYGISLKFFCFQRRYFDLFKQIIKELEVTHSR